MFGHPVPFPKRADSLLDLHFMVLVCFIVDLLDYGDDCDRSDNGRVIIMCIGVMNMIIRVMV